MRGRHIGHRSRITNPDAPVSFREYRTTPTGIWQLEHRIVQLKLGEINAYIAALLDLFLVNLGVFLRRNLVAQQPPPHDFMG